MSQNIKEMFMFMMLSNHGDTMMNQNNNYNLWTLVIFIIQHNNCKCLQICRGHFSIFFHKFFIYNDVFILLPNIVIKLK